ncbi:MAG: DNA repair protein RecN [Bacteroidota bacterium]
MLTSLTVKNYALIENLDVDFYEGLGIITGETGAGKSILLGALALVLGKRADSSSVNNKEKKCVVEAEFSIDKYHLESFFDREDLDYETITTIRREILPSGKSRAFVNDTPTTLAVLNALTKQLIDIHSQHETLQLADKNFQFQIIDALADNRKFLENFSKGLALRKQLVAELEKIEAEQQKANEEFEYNQFVLNELEEANLKVGELEELEESLEKLSHVEEIKQSLLQATQIAEGEEIGLKSLLHNFKNAILKISGYSKNYQELSERINSIHIEFDDIVGEIENENESVFYDPIEIEKLNDRLQLIYNLQKKHHAENIEELLKLRDEFSEKVEISVNAVEIISIKKKEIKEVEHKLNQLADKIHKNRNKAIPEFTKQLQEILANLEMKNTVLQINLNKTNSFLQNGKDEIEFLISADKGVHFEQIKKAASGGEMSRIMLAVKTILSKYTSLPTIVFDEIDTGVSGEVSNKIADVMLEMSNKMQVLAITHLPQIAAKGNLHYKVYKEEAGAKINSNIKLLDTEERVIELAEMLGGKEISKTAVEHAKQLLN